MEMEAQETEAPEVNLAEMSDDDLAAFEPETDTTPEAKEETAQEPGEPAKPPEDGTPQETPEDLAALKAEVEKLKKQRDEKEAFINRQGSEIGELRKMKQLVQERLQEIRAKDPTDQLINNPQEFRQGLSEEAQLNTRLQQIEQQEQQQAVIQQAAANREEVLRHYPDFETPETIEMIVEEAKAAGQPQEALDMVRNRPYMANPGYLMLYRERAMNKKAVAALQNQIADLKKKSETVVDRLARAASKPLTNSAGGSSSGGLDISSITSRDLAAMSDAQLAELDKLLK